jgi:hypothetical protein
MLIGITIVLADGTEIWRLVEVTGQPSPLSEEIDRQVHRLALDEELQIRRWSLYEEPVSSEVDACR